MTHQQLIALLASADPSGASMLATKLAKAASTITKIGEDIRTHVTGLPWHGEGGDAFRDWGSQTASATLRLGQYSEVASRWMEQVSQAITEAKAAMPPLSETTQAEGALRKAESSLATATDPANRNDPDARTVARSAESDATAAQGRIDAARGEAALRLRKLAQTYEFSAQQVNSVTPPTFPPPAMYMGGPGDWWQPQSHRALPGDGGAAFPQGMAAHQSLGEAPHSTESPEATRSERPADVHALPSRRETPTRMELDSLAPVTSAPPAPVGPLPPAEMPTSRPDLTGTPPSAPPPAPGRKTVTPSTPPVTGRPGTGGPRQPSLPGQAPQNTGTPGRLPRDSGITGGRPVPPAASSPAKGLPRGTVVGGEGTTPRGPMGHGLGGHMGHGASERGGAPGGRRLARESGGIVGGTPQQTGRSVSRPFTPGGTGLVSGAYGATAGRPAMAAASQGAKRSTGNREGRDGTRPEYLTEDEETWRQNDRRVVPPVID
ncbi:WXG100 family type VII secretion target [Streptomyces xantholiticus]